MARSRNRAPKPVRDNRSGSHRLRAASSSGDRLKDEVYRQMYLVETHRPGSEISLAIALLRTIVQADTLTDRKEIYRWLRTICPIGLRMLEDSSAAARHVSPDARA
jgi:hypothetical protein